MKTSCRILLLEDNPCIAESINQTFSLHTHFCIHHHDTAEAALKGLSFQPPDLMLSNIRLAGNMNGLELAYRIRPRFSFPIVFLTGESCANFQQKLIFLPKVYVLYKPFLPYQLLQVVNSALESRP